jgi:hypothetical protein
VSLTGAKSKVNNFVIDACFHKSYIQRSLHHSRSTNIYNKAVTSSTKASIAHSYLGGELGLDESKSLRTILVDVLLVRVGIVAIAAVRVRRVAVRFEPVGLGGRALEALGTGGKLDENVSTPMRRNGLSKLTP